MYMLALRGWDIHTKIDTGVTKIYFDFEEVGARQFYFEMTKRKIK